MKSFRRITGNNNNKILSLPFLWLIFFWTKANTFYCQSLFGFRRHGENTHVFPVFHLFNIQLSLDGLINSIEQKCLCECFSWKTVECCGLHTFEFKHYSTAASAGINQLKSHGLQLNKSLELLCHLPGFIQLTLKVSSKCLVRDISKLSWKEAKWYYLGIWCTVKYVLFFVPITYY